VWLHLLECARVAGSKRLVIGDCTIARMAFDTLTCENCGDGFKATSGANAAQEGYCSPACPTESEGQI